jgi:hypothetical protein
LIGAPHPSMIPMFHHSIIPFFLQEVEHGRYFPEV